MKRDISPLLGLTERDKLDNVRLIMVDWAAKEKQAEAQLEQARRLVDKRETRLEVIRELRREDEKSKGRGKKHVAK